MDFEGFFIACTTCSTRLKVRDLNAVGQIFGCPKCGSMVLVEAPEDMALPSESVPDDVVSGENSTPATPPSDWQAPASAKVGLLSKVAVSITLTVLLGIVGRFAWQHNPSIVDTQQQRAHDPAIEGSVSVDSQIGLAETQSETADPNEQSFATDEVNVGDEGVRDRPQPSKTEDLIATTAGEQVTDDLRVDEIFEEVSEDPTLLSQNTDSTPTSTILADSNIAPSLSPTGASLDSSDTLSTLATLLSGDTPDPSNSIVEVQDSEPGSSQDPTQTAEEARPNATLSNIHVASAKDQSYARTENVAEKLGRRLLAVRYEKVPLGHFLRSMVQLSGVPIQLDPSAIEQTAITWDSPISVSAIDKTMLEVLNSAVGSINLVSVVEGNVVRISASRVEDDRNISTTFFVGDLVRGRGGDLDLATLIPTLVAPSSWTDQQKLELRGNKLSATNSRAVLFDALVLLEKLRSARGLEPRKKLPARLTITQSKWQQINRYLTHQLSISIWEPVPFSTIVQRIEENLGLQVLVNWKALTEVAVSPTTLTSLRVRDQNASTVLRSFFDSYDLVIVPLGGKVVQLTSRTAMQAAPYIEFYDISKLDEQAMAKIESLMLQGKAAIDSASDFAIVNVDSETHRRLVMD